VVQPEDLQAVIWPLPCRKINGVGPKADAKLQTYGIHTIGALAAREKMWLVQHFGKSYGAWLHDAAWGRDDRPLETHSEPVTMSRETTFEHDLHPVRDRVALGQIFTRLCEQVAADLQRKGYAGRTVGIKLRDDRFTTITRNHTVDSAIDDAPTIRSAAGTALKRAPLKRPLRLLGVRVDGLIKRADVRQLQAELF
jgi:DNA polymerase-4